jgi:Type II secretion system (T2SS), protein E, N-terminal domain
MRQAAAISALPDGEFGTGLRARLEVVRTREREAEYVGSMLDVRTDPRRDQSPELALVSPDLSLGELLLETQVVTEAPLGTLLSEAGLLGDAEIDVALKHARAYGKRLGEVLVELGLVDPAEVVRLVAAQRGLPFVDVRTIPIDRAAARLLPIELARDNRALPVGFARGLPVVAVADPTDDGAMHGARSVLHSARFVASPEDSILYQLAQVYVPV